jgi:hypothetical protein
MNRSMMAVASLVVGTGMLWPVPASGQTVRGNPNPGSGILPPSARLLGQTLGEWGAAWWTWALETDAAENPVADPTGEFAGVNQSGPVFFLAGNFGGSTTRTCTVPAGKHLFFPLINSLWWAPEDIPLVEAFAVSIGLDPADYTDEENLRRYSNYQIDGVQSLSLEIDGVAIENLSAHRAESPAFGFELGDIYEAFGYPPGWRDLAVADGYWILLNPMPPGEHTIRFGSSFVDAFQGFTFELDVTYRVTVLPRGR